MRNLTAVTLAAVVFTIFPASAVAQDDAAANVAAARELLKSNNSVEAMVAGIRANLPLQRQAMPQVPEAFWVRFESRVTKEAPALVDSVATLYSRLFTLRELQDLTAFFKSPIGRRFVEIQPNLIAETSAIGQRWGARLGEQVAKELTE